MPYTLTPHERAQLLLALQTRTSPADLHPDAWRAFAQEAADDRRLDTLASILLLPHPKPLLKDLRKLAHKLRAQGLSLPAEPRIAHARPDTPPPSAHATPAGLLGAISLEIALPERGELFRLTLVAQRAACRRLPRPSLRYEAPPVPPSPSVLNGLRPLSTPLRDACILYARTLTPFTPADAEALRDLPGPRPDSPDPEQALLALRDAAQAARLPAAQLSLSADLLEELQILHLLAPSTNLLKVSIRLLQEHATTTLHPGLLHHLALRLLADLQPHTPEHRHLCAAAWINAALLATSPPWRDLAATCAALAEALHTRREAPHNIPLLTEGVTRLLAALHQTLPDAADAENPA